MHPELCAVLTGDLVAFTDQPERDQSLMLKALDRAFQFAREVGGKGSSDSHPVRFDRFRGDSFQGLLSDPREALKAALVLRAHIRSVQSASSKRKWDARVAIGIGTVKSAPERITEGDGEAFRRSGPALDQLTGRHRLALRTPWPEVDREMEVSAALSDALIERWTPRQAEVIRELLQDKTQEQIADTLDITQSAVSYRVRGTGWFALKELLERYRRRVDEQVSRMT